MFRKAAAAIAILMFTFPAIAADPVVNPDQPLEGIDAKCGVPPAIPGKMLGCMHQPSTGKTACVYQMGIIEDALGIRWAAFLTIGQSECGGAWEPVQLKCHPFPGQKLSKGEAI